MSSSKKPCSNTAIRAAMIRLAFRELDDALLPPDIRPDEYAEFAARLRHADSAGLRPIDNVNASKRKQK